MKKISQLFLMFFLLLNLSGCIALLAGGAAGAGTAVWLSGKLSQQFDASYEQSVKASERALNSLGYRPEKITREAEVTQIKSEYSDGREIWIDVRKITPNSSKVEVRVGGLNSDKQAAGEILERIEQYI